MPRDGRPRRDAGPQGPAARRGLRARAVGRLAACGVALVVALASAAAPAWAASDDAYCTGASYGDEPAKAGPPIRFGIDPELAGTVGAGQGDAVPLDEAKDLAALRDFRPPGKALVLRVNRLFWADGQAGIDKFKAIVARHDAAGFDSEIQVRYHPAAGDEGNLEKWAAYVRHVVDEFAADRHVVAMTITNEVNLNISQNTSDGAYSGARDALIQGIIAARDEADRRGRPDMTFGFTYAYRWQPGSDAAFWTALGAAPDAFRHALGFVGVDIYPGTFYPPAIAPTTTAGHEMLVGLSTVRNCFMPKAKLGAAVPLWVTENGFQSGPSGDDAGQAAALQDMIGKTIAAAGTYNVTDYRWFNLRDNKTGGSAMFETTGLLHDDYTRKPAFAALRDLIAAHGADTPRATPPACVSAVTLTLPKGTRRYAARLDGRRVRGRRSGRRLTITFKRAGKRRVVVVARRAGGRTTTLRRTARACAAARAAAARRTHSHTIVTLEFDVATADQASALPLLERYGYHGTFFVNSGFINHPGHLTWDQLRNLQAKGNEIAGQTIHHTWLTRLGNAQLEHEVCDDRGKLLAEGLAVDAFAYPFGAYDRRVRNVVIGCGYSSARLATGIAGAGKRCLRCPYAESIPPHNRFATRMPPAFQRTSKIGRMIKAVRAAQRTGGGWVQVLIHHVCNACHRYAITPAHLARFLRWLKHSKGVEVRTVSQLMDIGGPTVQLTPVGGASHSVGDFVTFRARPHSRHGVSRVRFFVDGDLIGTRHIAPYRFRWYAGRLRPGQHVVRALLEDERGNAAISSRQLFVKPAPTPAGHTGPDTG